MQRDDLVFSVPFFRSTSSSEEKRKKPKQMYAQIRVLCSCNANTMQRVHLNKVKKNAMKKKRSFRLNDLSGHVSVVESIFWYFDVRQFTAAIVRQNISSSPKRSKRRSLPRFAQWFVGSNIQCKLLNNILWCEICASRKTTQQKLKSTRKKKIRSAPNNKLF